MVWYLFIILIQIKLKLFVFSRYFFLLLSQLITDIKKLLACIHFIKIILNSLIVKRHLLQLFTITIFSIWFYQYHVKQCSRHRTVYDQIIKIDFLIIYVYMHLLYLCGIQLFYLKHTRYFYNSTGKINITFEYDVKNRII